MATAIDYALMAGAAYISTRPDINKFPIPSGWLETKHANPQDGSGFEAITFINGTTIATSTDIVISYAGTDPADIGGDVAADLVLIAGLVTSAQLLQAAEYYMAVKAANQDANITLTGHSLGGGLAALIAVLFDETAKTFDQAPFRLSANLVIATDLKNDLTTKFPVSDYPQITTWLDPLDKFISSFDDQGGPQDGLAAREAKVTNTSVQGEVASTTNSLKIGTEYPAPLTHGDYFHPVDLHSQTLLTAFLQSQQTAVNGQTLSEATKKLTDLLEMIFDKNLFAHETDPRSTDRNLLEHLVRHEAGVRDPATGATTIAADQMVYRFTTDLWKVAQDNGLTLTDNDLTKTLVAFAMQKYYEEQATDTDYGKALFSSIDVTGGIRFDRSDVATNLADAKGYNLYFQNYLDSLSTKERAAVVQMLPALTDWFVQAGSAPMNATASGNSAFMLGDSGGDRLTGGSQADLLVGNGGNDTLDGGAGADTMAGGSGDDDYTVDDSGDTVIEQADAGTDTVHSSVSYTLPDNVEKLILIGSDSSDGTGNGLDNILTGNVAANTLAGGAGSDILHGDDGAGGDILEGGAGYDIYFADDGDTIRDSDGQGSVILNGKTLSFATRKEGEVAYKDAAGNVYLLNGSTLSINDPLTIENFTPGGLGIQLREEPKLKDEFDKAEKARSPIVLDLDGNRIASRGISEGVFFDHDGNGFAERSGWVTPSDGLLVRDINANGKIDTGAELFGDHTQLKNGQIAANIGGTGNPSDNKIVGNAGVRDDAANDSNYDLERRAA